MTMTANHMKKRRRIFSLALASRSRWRENNNREPSARIVKFSQDLHMFSFKPIGYIHSSYKNTREVPKGLGAEHQADGVLEILPELELGLTDVEGFSHLIVLWAFHQLKPEDEMELLATPPSDKQPHGVFATRSPRRPNPIGLTVVELLRRDGRSLHVRGVDMLDGTPILDLKPYLSSIPIEKLRRGWLGEAEARAHK